MSRAIDIGEVPRTHLDPSTIRIARTEHDVRHLERSSGRPQGEHITILQGRALHGKAAMDAHADVDRGDRAVDHRHRASRLDDQMRITDRHI